MTPESADHELKRMYKNERQIHRVTDLAVANALDLACETHKGNTEHVNVVQQRRIDVDFAKDESIWSQCSAQWQECVVFI